MEIMRPKRKKKLCSLPSDGFSHIFVADSVSLSIYKIDFLLTFVKESQTEEK
jgi:hypothetical protein